MAATYPTSAKAFTTKSALDIVQPAHVNDLQDEVTAIETALLTGLAHGLIMGAALRLAGFQLFGSQSAPLPYLQYTGTTWLFGDSNSNKMTIDVNGILGLPIGPIEMSEIADPSAPAANKGRVYVRDNGSGKSQLCCRFPSGAVQIICTEP